MKKTISLIVAVTLIMAMAIPALAAQPEVVGTSACSHKWGPETASILWARYSDTSCKKTVVVTKVCTLCSEISRTETITYPNHGAAVSKATCDGTTQTWTYSCPNCGAYRYTDWVTCPGAGQSHTTGCLWLPV